MTVKDIPKLLEKLNDYCQSTLATGVGVCVSRGHYEVRWEHLLMEFIDRNDGDIPLILRQFEVDLSHLKKSVTLELENLRTGNTGKPLFSPPLLDEMEYAWGLASLDLGLSSITSGALFLAALERGQMAMSSYSDLLRGINVETLKKDFFTITKTSVEQAGKSGAPGATSGAAGGKGDVLEQFCTNFTQQARDGKIDPVLGRDNEIRQALDILSRRRKNNPILVGEAGVGKTAIVEGLALRIAAGDVPDHLKNVDLWGLDLGLLQAGASVKGEFEKRLKNVIDAIKNSPKPTILFIDEAHTLIGAGGAAGQGDAANLLKPALARGELRTLAATTWAEYRKYFEKDPALARRFQLVKIDEPDEETCSIMMRGIGASYEKHHKVRITYDGIRAAVSYSHRYISGRQLPDKAVDVLDTACARVKMSQSARPASLDSAERALLNAQLELKTLQKDLDAGITLAADSVENCNKNIDELRQRITALTEQWNKEKEIAVSIIKLQDDLVKARENKPEEKTIKNFMDKLDEETKRLESVQGENPMVFPNVSAAVCAQVIADWTGIPVGSMVKDEAASLLEIESKLGERVIGQDDAISEVANTIRASKTGMGNPDAPLGVFLFSGPSGVGKTECALALADLLFGGEKFMTIINMSEYQEKHTVSQLKGAPPGYVGYGEGGILTDAVRQKPYSIVILDEVEKAHLEVMNLFYQVFDKGFMRDGEGREINFRNTLIIMTSNLASSTIVEMCSGKEEVSTGALIEAIRPELSAHFQPALLARCKIIPFRPLGIDVMRGVVAIKLDKIAQRINKAHGITLSCSPELVDKIAESCTAVESGARNADAVIDQSLLPGISRQLLLHLGEEDKNYTRVHIGSTPEGDFEIVFSEKGDELPQESPQKEKSK
ncbi:MAG TPA: type VI secretion system ATPase TssH [Fibrobacteres bacterium]|jgi:type VI secretion system protein VasG|nr:type VI secretion system ATPase TssH [Fibrobacterota bacterium]